MATHNDARADTNKHSLPQGPKGEVSANRLKLQVRIPSSDRPLDYDLVSPADSLSIFDVPSSPPLHPIRAVKIYPSVETASSPPSLSYGLSSTPLSNAGSLIYVGPGSSSSSSSVYMRLPPEEPDSNYAPSISSSEATSSLLEYDFPTSDDSWGSYCQPAGVSLMDAYVESPASSYTSTSVSAPSISESFEHAPLRSTKRKTKVLTNVEPIPVSLRSIAPLQSSFSNDRNLETSRAQPSSRSTDAPSVPARPKFDLIRLIEDIRRREVDKKTMTAVKPPASTDVPEAGTFIIPLRSSENASDASNIRARAQSSIPPPEFYGQVVDTDDRSARLASPELQFSLPLHRLNPSNKTDHQRMPMNNADEDSKSTRKSEQTTIIDLTVEEDDAHQTQSVTSTSSSNINKPPESSHGFQCSGWVAGEPNEMQKQPINHLKRRQAIREQANEATPRKKFKSQVMETMESMCDPEKEVYERELAGLLGPIFINHEVVPKGTVTTPTTQSTEASQTQTPDSVDPVPSQASQTAKKSKRIPVSELQKTKPKLPNMVPDEGGLPDEDVIRIAKLLKGYDRHVEAPYAFSYRGRIYGPWKRLLQARDDAGSPVFSTAEVKRLTS